MLRRNRPHTPATALGHITASRSNIRSTRRRPKLQDASDTSSSDSAAPKFAQAVTRSHFKHLRQPNIDPTPRKRVRIVSPTDLAFTTTETMHHPILENLTQYQPTNYRTSSSGQKSYTPQIFGTTQSSRTYLGVFLSRPSMARNTCWSQSSSAIYTSNHCAADQPINSSPPIQPPTVGSKPMATIPSSRS